MRKILASVAVLTAAVAFSVPAYAQEVMGVIKTYRPADRVIILEDGTQYLIQEGVTVQQYQPGAKVRFVVTETGGKRYITKIITAE